MSYLFAVVHKLTKRDKISRTSFYLGVQEWEQMSASSRKGEINLVNVSECKHHPFPILSHFKYAQTKDLTAKTVMKYV